MDAPKHRSDQRLSRLETEPHRASIEGVSETARKIIAEATALPRDDVEEILEALVDHIHGRSGDETAQLDPELKSVVQRRIEEIRRGEVEGIDDDVVHRDVLRKLHERRS